jgi:hypothetical protein
MIAAAGATSNAIASAVSPVLHLLSSTPRPSPSSSKVPLVATRWIALVATTALRSSRERSSQNHHGAQYLTGVHLVEGLLDAVQSDALGDELLQGQPALQVEADQGGEVALG